MSAGKIQIKKGIDLFEAEDSPDLLSKARKFAMSKEMSGSPISQQILQIVADRGLYLSGNWKHYFQRLVALFTGCQYEVLRSEKDWYPVAYYTIHCPPVEGARATLEYGEGKDNMRSSTIEILGIGGGPNFTIEMEDVTGVEISEHSIALVVDFECTWELIRLTTPAGDVSEFWKLSDIDKSYKSLKAVRIDSAKSIVAQVGIEEVKTYVVDPIATLTSSLLVKAGCEYKISKSLKLEKLGIEIGTEATASHHHQLKYTYLLPGGYNYKAVRPVNCNYWIWELV